MTPNASPWHAARVTTAALVKTARPGFWPTTILFYFLPIGQRDVFALPAFWIGLLCVTFPLGLLAYGWNDLLDTETDRSNARKDSWLFGARAGHNPCRVLWRWIVGTQVLSVLLIARSEGFGRAAAWIATLIGAVAVYNQPPLQLKGRPPFDLLTQGAYLLVFVLSSWLNDVPQLPWQTFAFGALFAMHSHLFGEIMDIDVDRNAGRTTTAVLLGPVRAKVAIAALLLFEAAWVWAFFRDAWIAAFLATSATWFMADAFILWRERAYTPAEMRGFFLSWNAIALGSLPWVWGHASLTRLAV